MKVLLVQHNGGLKKTNPYTRSNTLGTLSIEYLAASAESKGHQVFTINDNFDSKSFTEILNSIKPDIVGFSVYSYTYKESVDLAKIVKDSSQPQTSPFTIFGGYHPTACPIEVASNKYVDFAVVGEGEQTLCELLHSLEQKQKAWHHITGLAFELNGEVVLNPPRERIINLDQLPLPKRDKHHLSQSKFYQISFPPPSKQKSVAQILSSRGCPFSCSYCASSMSWRNQVVWRDPEKVCDELETLLETYGTNIVFFNDLTLNANKKRLLELCRAIHNRNLPLHWWGMFRLDLLDEEILEALVSANCIKLSLGIESPIQLESRKLKDKFVDSTENISNIINVANNLGLIIRSYIVIGFPDDTKQKIASYPKYLSQLGIDEIRITFATPFPGTRFFNEVQKMGLIPRKIDWNKLSTEIPYLMHPSISKQELLKLRKEIIVNFYLSKEYENHIMFKIEKFPFLKQSWVEYLQFLNSKEVFHGHEVRLIKLLKKIQLLPNSNRELLN